MAQSAHPIRRFHLPTRDYLNIGLKLLGVYFAVLGVTVLAMVLANLTIEGVLPLFQQDEMLHAIEGPVVSAISALQPIAYLVCAFVLTRKTEWCLHLICPPSSGG